MAEPIKVNIVVYAPPPPRPWIQDLLMACKNCGATMMRGGQCGRCRAWCR